jgi:hypothetical protein
MTHRVTESADQPPIAGLSATAARRVFSVMSCALRRHEPLLSFCSCPGHVRGARQPLLTPILSALAAGTFIYFGRLHGLANGALVARRCEFRSYSLPDLNSAVAGFGTYGARAS